MGLSFTNIADRDGAALYVLYDGTTREQQQWTSFGKEVANDTGAQVVVLSVKDQDGEAIRDFYDLSETSLPHVLIVRDSDEVAQVWSGTDLPSLSDVAYVLRQTGV